MSEIELLNVSENGRRVEIRVGKIIFEFFKYKGTIFHQEMNFGGGSSYVPKKHYQMAYRQAAAILNKK